MKSRKNKINSILNILPGPENPLNDFPYGNWPGGIAVKDILGCFTRNGTAICKQELYAGGWYIVSFKLVFQPMEDNPFPNIWKEIWTGPD